MKDQKFNPVLISILVLACFVSCAKKDSGSSSSTDIQETAQQIGDVMASIDESSGSSSTGSYATVDLQSTDRMFARVLPSSRMNVLEDAFQDLKESLIPKAEAAACGLSTFSSCASNVITRTFGGCTIGSATLDGTVTLTWNDLAVNSTCQMTASSHSISRSPNFTITGRRGGTLTVSKTGTNGQVITRGATSSDYSFTNDGIKRVIVYQGSTLFDFTTETTAALTITGATRNGRVLTSAGGAGLKVTNNLNSVSCTYTPTSVTWSSTCTCAVSGSWASTCSDGKSSNLTITGCGTADFTMGTASESLYFDRCYSL
ncbi:MAG: hypothetical protein K2X47_14850 [Bdellovibrionales bacterium]|nr:hypothetical protein [Bdellovibrionales bacterium]